MSTDKVGGPSRPKEIPASLTTFELFLGCTSVTSVNFLVIYVSILGDGKSIIILMLYHQWLDTEKEVVTINLKCLIDFLSQTNHH